MPKVIKKLNLNGAGDAMALFYLRFAFVSMMTLCVPTILAQTASTNSARIIGVVTDKTGETLIGANVLLEGTSIGTVTDIDGYYRLDRLPSGSYNLIVRYMGYKGISTPVNLVDGKVLEMDFQLENLTYEGEEIVITAMARGQVAAINDQLSSKTIKNVVSSEKIQELPDDNAAKALSRLPGVSIQSGDKIVIRGIQAKMNKVLVNGIELPSTSMNDRSTSLGFVSSNMLSGIEVFKVVTPDMDADAIGGTVNLRLKEAPDDFHVDGLIQGQYNTQDHTYDNYKSWLSLSNRFFNKKLGIFAQGNIQRSNSGQERGKSIYELGLGTAGDDPGYGLGTYGLIEYHYQDDVEISENIGGSLLIDYKVGESKFILMNTYSDQDINYASYGDNLELSTGYRLYALDRDIYSRKILVNSLQGEHNLTGVYVDYSFTHSYSARNTDLSYEIDFKSGTNAFDPIEETSLTSYRADDIYGIELFEDDWKRAAVGTSDVWDDSFNERKLAAAINIEIPVTINENISGRIKTGGKIHRMTRESDRNKQIARLSEVHWNDAARDFLEKNNINPDESLKLKDFKDQEYLDERGKYFLNGAYDMSTVVNIDLMDPYIRLSSPTWFTDFADTWRHDYNGTEDLSAAYAMAEINIGSKLMLLGGIRYEELKTNYHGYFTIRTHFETGYNLDTLNHAIKNHLNWFPNLQIRYKATDWFDVRFAYSKTASRPDYRYILPSRYIRVGEAGYSANTNLKPTISQNLDLYTSFHHKSIGLFTAGTFFKEMTNVYYPTARMAENLPEEVEWPEQGVNDIPTINTSAQVKTYMNNPYPAKVLGVELDWQTNFWYLPEPFNALVFNINYTRVYSSMDYQEFRLYEYFEPNPNPGRPPIKRFAEVDTFRTARLLQQGDHIINIALGADIKGFSGRISFNLQDDVISYVGNRPEEDQFIENYYTFDLSLKQKLPVKGLSVYFNATNLFNASEDGFRIFGPDFSAHNNAYKFYNPRLFQLGLRYKL